MQVCQIHYLLQKFTIVSYFLFHVIAHMRFLFVSMERIEEDEITNKRREEYSNFQGK